MGKKKEENLGWQKNTLLYVHDLMYLLLIVMLLFLLVFRIIVVSGASMKMTLLDGDYLLLLSNTFYHQPERGDIVVISKESFDNGKPIVKRVIATEGQTVDIDFENGIVYVDGEAQQEDYINVPTTVDGGTPLPLTVAEGCLFVMGDNRGVSLDSRYPEVGQVDKREVLGKAIFLMYPGTDDGNYPREMRRIGAVQ